MRALVIDDNVKNQIGILIAFAKRHVYTNDLLIKVLSGEYPPAGDYDGHSMGIPNGYKVVFSFEDQEPGRMRHLSVSVDDASKMPSPPAVELIMSEFGMGNDIHDCVNVWIDKETNSINVLTMDIVS